MLSFKPSFSLSSFTFIKRFFNSSSFSAISMVPSVYLRFLYSFDVLLSQSETSPSYNCSLFSSNCCFLTCIQFLRRKVRWSGIPVSLRIFQFVVIHTVKGFNIVNEAEVFLELPCFFHDPTDIDNLISGSSVFSKSNLNI